MQSTQIDESWCYDALPTKDFNICVFSLKEKMGAVADLLRFYMNYFETIHVYNSNSSANNLDQLMNQQLLKINALRKYGQRGTSADRLLFIFDGLPASQFRESFIKLCLYHRKCKASVIVVTEKYIEIPRIVRTCFDYLIIFE